MTIYELKPHASKPKLISSILLPHTHHALSASISFGVSVLIPQSVLHHPTWTLLTIALLDRATLSSLSYLLCLCFSHIAAIVDLTQPLAWDTQQQPPKHSSPAHAILVTFFSSYCFLLFPHTHKSQYRFSSRDGTSSSFCHNSSITLAPIPTKISTAMCFLHYQAFHPLILFFFHS